MGDEIASCRPVFTGDVFTDVPIHTSSGAITPRTVIVLQHPCAMRSDGVNLTARQLVSQVRQHRPLERDEWKQFSRLMSLADFYPQLTSTRRHQAAMFDIIDTVAAIELRPERRIVCLTQVGVNLLLQRWVHHNTRVVVPLLDIAAVTSGPFEEADLMEEWGIEALDAGITVAVATAECLAWLREEAAGGGIRQRLLEDPQYRGAIRREMRVETRKRYAR